MSDDNESNILDTWDCTTQGYVRGPWRLYHCDSWCVALRGDFERMVNHNFRSAEDAARWATQTAAALLQGWHERAVVAEAELARRNEQDHKNTTLTEKELRYKESRLGLRDDY